MTRLSTKVERGKCRMSKETGLRMYFSSVSHILFVGLGLLEKTM